MYISNKFHDCFLLKIVNKATRYTRVQRGGVLVKHLDLFICFGNWCELKDIYLGCICPYNDVMYDQYPSVQKGAIITSFLIKSITLASKYQQFLKTSLVRFWGR